MNYNGNSFMWHQDRQQSINRMVWEAAKDIRVIRPFLKTLRQTETVCNEHRRTSSEQREGGNATDYQYQAKSHAREAFVRHPMNTWLCGLAFNMVETGLGWATRVT
jgi:hypothetical protein